MEFQRSARYRVNVSQTSTGKKSWDCTVEVGGEIQPMRNPDVAPINGPVTIEEVLAQSDALVAELEKRYPPAEPEGGYR